MQPNIGAATDSPLHISPNKIQLTALLVLITIQAVLVVVFAYEGTLWVIGPVLGIFFLTYTALSVEKIFYFLLFYIIVFEELYYGGRFAGLPIYFLWPVSTALLAVLFVYWVVHLIRTKYTYEVKALDGAIIIFLSLALLSAVHGYLRSYDATSWRWDLLPYAFYLAYFIVIYSKLRTRPLVLANVILFLCIPVAFEMIYALANSRGMILFQRIVTQNIHLMQFAVPFAGLMAIYSETRGRRILGTLLLPVFVFAVLISQQRALMLTVFLTLIALFVIYARAKRQSTRERLKFMALRSLIALALLTVPFIIIELFTEESLFLTFFSRFYIFLNPVNVIRDSSWQIRWQEIIRAWPLVTEFFMFGAGFGATTISRHRLILQITLDNSYVYLIWKMGVVGLLSFLSIYYIVIKRCRLILKATDRLQEKIFAMAVLMNTIGLLIVGMTNVCIAHYRFIFVWLATIAGIEIIARQYD